MFGISRLLHQIFILRSNVTHSYLFFPIYMYTPFTKMHRIMAVFRLLLAINPSFLTRSDLTIINLVLMSTSSARNDNNSFIRNPVSNNVFMATQSRKPTKSLLSGCDIISLISSSVNAFVKSLTLSCRNNLTFSIGLTSIRSSRYKKLNIAFNVRKLILIVVSASPISCFSASMYLCPSISVCRTSCN